MQGLVGNGSAAAFSATYIAILLALAVFLALNVARHRKPKQIGIGDGGDRTLHQAMRVHGNFTENVPFALAALVMLPLIGAPAWTVHLVGIGMIAARILHAIGLSSSQGYSSGRFFGIMLNWLVLLVSAALLIWFAWR